MKLLIPWLGAPELPEPEPKRSRHPKAPKPPLVVERRKLGPTKLEITRARYAATVAERERQAVERQAGHRRQLDLRGIAPGIGRGAGRQARARVGW